MKSNSFSGEGFKSTGLGKNKDGGTFSFDNFPSLIASKENEILYSRGGNSAFSIDIFPKELGVPDEVLGWFIYIRNFQKCREIDKLWNFPRSVSNFKEGMIKFKRVTDNISAPILVNQKENQVEVEERQGELIVNLISNETSKYPLGEHTITEKLGFLQLLDDEKDLIHLVPAGASSLNNIKYRGNEFIAYAFSSTIIYLISEAFSCIVDLKSEMIINSWAVRNWEKFI